jgi:hypothetical protein
LPFGTTTTVEKSKLPFGTTTTTTVEKSKLSGSTVTTVDPKPTFDLQNKKTIMNI